MKRVDLIRHLERHGVQFLREGGSHSVYVNRTAGKTSTIPRHREINDFLAQKICKDLARIIHERFCCNRGFAAATSLDRVARRPGRRARRLVDQHTVSSMPHSRTALRACLAWRLRDFATNHHE